MEITKDKRPSTAAELRLRAEEQLKANMREAVPPRTDDETQRLLLELQVHQIELEMQNEELRQARDEVEAALEKYTDLYDFAPVGYVTLDRDEVIRAANHTCAHLLGVERSRLIGRHFGLFISPEAGPAFTAYLRKVFESPTNEVFEVALPKGANRPIFVQVEARTAASGQECRIALSDITERKRVEEALRESEEQFRVQVECVKDYAIFMLDPLGNVLNWNAGAERLKGYKAEEIIGKHFSCFYSEEERNAGKPTEELEKAAAEGHVEVFGWRVRKDGSRFWADVIITALHHGNGNLRGFSKVTRDITERKELEEKLEILHTDLEARAAELEAANIELEAFNYSVTHDLRKPLTVINGYCQLLKHLCEGKLDEEAGRYIQEIYEGTLRMNRLIDTLLGFSRVTRVELRRETIDLTAMAKAVAAELELAEPGRRVMVRIAAGIVAVGDADLLRVALNNLMGNAWKYTRKREEAVIEFGVTEIDGKPAWFVRDNGPGFDMALADKLFLPFQQLAGMGVEGHGIGLATVERIVSRHRGRVWAESEPGKGATFYFTLE